MSYESIQDIQKLLEQMFKDFNRRFYDEKLIAPMITIMKSRRGNQLGWCSAQKIWLEKDAGSSNQESEYNNTHYELNICADALNRSIHELADTMLHEMAHLYDLINNINDTSRSGSYHNKRYKETAETHGLICEFSKEYGYSSTRLNEEALDFLKYVNYPELNIVRAHTNFSNSSYLRYVCPTCGAIIRSTRAVRVMCMECNMPFIYEAKRPNKTPKTPKNRN